MMPARHAEHMYSRYIRLLVVAVIAFMFTVGSISPIALAAPGAGAPSAIHGQNVDWMPPDMAATLDLPMDVLVPTWVPAPFGDVSPSVTASGGYYQLYWMVSGGSPTFLYIEGTVGGALPAGSPADLNKPLSINASVQGWNAIHDVGIPAGSGTPIYDQVWWIANGVLYTVASNNMAGADSLSLANSLVVLQPPVAAPPAPSAPEEPSYDAPVEREPDTEWTNPSSSDTGRDGGHDSAPVVTDSESSVSADGSDVSEREGDASAESSGSPDAAPGRSRSGWSPDRYDGAAPSDGTSGPLPPVIGTDGTGGFFDTALPSMLFTP